MYNIPTHQLFTTVENLPAGLRSKLIGAFSTVELVQELKTRRTRIDDEFADLKAKRAAINAQLASLDKMIEQLVSQAQEIETARLWIDQT